MLPAMQHNACLPCCMVYKQGFDSVAWDHDVMHGCLCDSTWAVGYTQGETQLAEYFGADCSLSE
jgi:hypothetical protein